ncbi:MAG TPA: SPFH domain-containing protein [Xanthomonadaceae bacterium]|jgi:hypothetical protein|nr:SPFH domain-containing protein [Xanthomonadaceae bacterium]
MFGFNYFKASPSQYVLQFHNGQIVREGAGLSFFYFAPSASLVSIPLAAVEAPFMFEETTRDFQAVSLQGQVSYRIAQPRQLAQQQDFTVTSAGAYVSEDPKKLPVRVLNLVKTQFRTLLQGLDLQQVLSGSEQLARAAHKGLAESPALKALGIEIGDLGLMAVKPNPETTRALEAPMREQILRQSDDATYARRNAAIEQERTVKENELRSELIVEQKKRQVRETQVESERVILEKKQQIQMQDLRGKVELEKDNGELVQLRCDNQRQEADAKAYDLKAIIDVLRGMDARSLQALLVGQASPETLMALGFQSLADNAAKIGEFNFSPDLLRQIAKAKG